jgi:hypothetical protein
MTKKIDFPERRKHERFKVKEGILAFSSPDYDRVGQIKDVSKGGLAFQHLVITESTEEPFEVENTMGLYALFSIRQLSLQFRRLNHSQKLLLDHFIQRYTHK